MDKRAYKNGITRCGAHDKYAEQQTCDDFLKATYHNRCMFCISGDICDWNPDMACVVKKKSLREVAEDHFKWPSKEQLAERQQAVIDSTDCGV